MIWMAEYKCENDHRRVEIMELDHEPNWPMFFICEVCLDPMTRE